MINLISKTCQHDGCNTIPVFGIEGGLQTHCAKHKTPDMINLTKTCQHDGCNTIPVFGIQGGLQTHCAKHKTPDMINLISKTCQHDGCNTIPVFGIEGGLQTHCAKHKTPDMINVVSKTCISEWCTYTVNNDNKYDGYCINCFKYLFPHDERTSKIRTKTKEDLVRDAINDHFEGFEHDKAIVWGGCDCTVRRRIDHRKLINGTMLAIETDERQHRSYDAKDEENRYNDLFVGAYSGKWIFIRFNPDAYTDSKGKKRKGMFDYNGKQICHEVKRRKQLLIEEIEKQIKRIESDENHELLEIKKLFFDGF